MIKSIQRNAIFFYYSFIIFMINLGLPRTILITSTTFWISNYEIYIKLYRHTLYITNPKLKYFKDKIASDYFVFKKVLLLSTIYVSIELSMFLVHIILNNDIFFSKKVTTYIYLYEYLKNFWLTCHLYVYLSCHLSCHLSIYLVTSICLANTMYLA